MKPVEPYVSYALAREMMQTTDVIRSFDSGRARALGAGGRPVFLTGEGSSRIFPAKRAVSQALRNRRDGVVLTEACSQAAEYDLTGYEVYVASNSGRTAEAVRLVQKIRSRGPQASTTALVANGDSPVAGLCDRKFVLDCGQEQAMAATKSVVEQALFYHVALSEEGETPDLASLADAFEQTLSVSIPADIVDSSAAAQTIYFAGRNDGVAEELTLKTNEITRIKSDFLEGTYAVHGIEEVMDESDILVLIDPFPDAESKIQQVLGEGVGLRIAAVSARETLFPTIRIPDIPGAGPYLQLAAGWNLLVEIGLACGVDLDKPVRARKVGNEFIG